MSSDNLTNEDLPPLYEAADSSSLAAQNRLLLSTRLRLGALVAASAFGLATWTFGKSPTDWAGVLATSCFVLALFVEVYLLKAKPERTWYEARAAAESVKTLSWRFAVGGEPFRIGSKAEKDIESLFLQQLQSVLDVLKDIDLNAPHSAAPQISAKMKEVRASPIDARKAAYERGRVIDQQDWYQQKAVWNQTRAQRWIVAMLIIEVAGITAGILKAIGLIAGDLLSFAGALVAALIAWLQTKQHRTLGTAYAITALELATVRTKLHHHDDEHSWAEFVADAEEAFSREHTLWKASRGVRSI